VPDLSGAPGAADGTARRRPISGRRSLCLGYHPAKIISPTSFPEIMTQKTQQFQTSRKTLQNEPISARTSILLKPIKDIIS
jgi:hypothetical protein